MGYHFKSGDLPSIRLRHCAGVHSSAIAFTRVQGWLLHAQEFPVLNCSAVSLTLDNQVILQDITFAQRKDELIGVIGPNGAGKSTLLRLIQGSHKPDSGQILLQQRNLSTFNAKQLAQTIAVVNQHSQPLFALTVEQVATMGLLPHKSWFELNSSEDVHRVKLALEKVGLSHKASQLIDTLSGGELQRLYIARSLVHQPELLLLD